MSAELQPGVQLEIGHVLFLDVVGYSKLLLDEQRELQQQLTQIVRNTEQVRAAEAAGKGNLVPAREVIALAFFYSPGTPVRLPIQNSQEPKGSPREKLLV